ncbi:SLC13 family permease [Treponema sp. HNW]|uniref:GntP family permease n=1 Tax=Treponema sp. HNW TaxID=3116654 RepID=UPI003D117D5A
MNVLVAFIITMAVLLISLIVFKISPGVSLFSCAVLMALLCGLPLNDILSYITSGFGNIMTAIGLLILFGGIFGMMLGDSGGMEELAKGLLRTFGKKNDMLALNLAGFIVSIPVYFGSAYITLNPLVNSLQKLTKKDTSAYVAALFTGLLLTHCVVAPTPGPLAVAGQIGANIGWFIIYGIIVSLPASLLCGWQYANILNRRSFAVNSEAIKKEAAALSENAELLKADKTKPSAGLTLALIAFPIVLIVINSIFKAVLPAKHPFVIFFGFVGNNNVALFIAMLLTGIVLRRYLVPLSASSLWNYIDKVSDKMGNILMVIGCGNCFGTILQKSGLDTALVELLSKMNIPVLLLAFVLAMIIRAAVGSATVAMLTAVAIVGPSAVAMGYSPVIIGLAICTGTVGLTLPTDAAFWLPARYSNITVKEAFIATTWPTTFAGLTGFLIILLLNAFSHILPGLL